jgi:uncharacterized BrkB/YihY/UPF0761 family membrane protein
MYTVFYLLFLFTAIALAAGIQVPLAEKVIENPFDIIDEVRGNPAKILVLIFYHVILSSLFSVWLYFYLLKKQTELTWRSLVRRFVS